MQLLFLIPLFPLIGFLLNGLFGRRFGKNTVSVIGCGAPFLSLLVTVWACVMLAGQQALTQTLFTWVAIPSTGLNIDFTLRFDTLTAVMALVVCGVGFLIHVYSIGYMGHDEGYARYFAYLNLFMAMMLILVMADNLILLFVGWEGVGLTSYLLIGFWYRELKNADAGKKAFIVNRIGDFGFLLGLFFLFALFGTLSISQLKTGIVNSPSQWTWLTVVALLLFAGACGKSAQIPLYVWLPDAMAGPTPVSALIHAATMVAAGVYMVCRLDFIFLHAPLALDVMGGIAAATALLAAIWACAERDIKKVLAYSTISQLGYMFMALGAAAFSVGMFHLVTHAFFKALLFLAAGAVIHVLEEQDLTKLGGLAKYPALRWALFAFVIGGLALAGVPPLAGFFSKDAILESLYEKSLGMPTSIWFWIWLSALVTAALTAFYIARLVIRIFFTSPPETHHSPLTTHHSLGGSMKFTLGVLMALSLVGGLIGKFAEAKLHGAPPEAHGGGATLNLVLSLCASFGGIALAAFLYLRRQDALRRFVGCGVMQKLYTFVAHKFYVDEFYHALIVAPLKMMALGLWYLIDRIVIDRSLDRLADGVYGASRQLRRIHTGAVSVSLAVMVLGALAFIAYLLYIILQHA